MSRCCRFNRLAAAVTVLLCITCSNDPALTGPSTQEGNPQVVAIVIDSLKQPVANVTVSTFRIPDTVDTLLFPVPPTLISQGITDSRGCCTFSRMAAGTYSIEANHMLTKQRAIKAGITIISDSTGKRTDTLQLNYTGTICGVVTRGYGIHNNQSHNVGNGGIMVIIQETGAPSKLTPPDGIYSFNALPPGLYTIFYYDASREFYSSKRSFTIFPGDTVFADTVVLKAMPTATPPAPKGFSAVYDTAAAILHLSWQKVVYDSLRWYELQRYDFSGPNDIQYTLTDTFFIDSLAGIPTGSRLIYVIRAVSNALNPSVNAGPVEIILP